VVLGAVFALPESTRRSLAFAYTDPTVRTAFTAHYVHLDVDHLAGNVAGYVVLAGVGYALAVLAGCRRFFMVALATFLAAFPVVLSALNLAVPRNAISFGFSGINMAFAGLLPLLLGVYARERFFPEASIRALPAVFFPLVGWMAFLALPVSPGSLDEPGLAGLATAVGWGSCSVCCTRRAPGSGSDGRSETGFGRRSRTPATATCSPSASLWSSVTRLSGSPAIRRDPTA